MTTFHILNKIAIETDEVLRYNFGVYYVTILVFQALRFILAHDIPGLYLFRFELIANFKWIRNTLEVTLFSTCVFT